MKLARQLLPIQFDGKPTWAAVGWSSFCGRSCEISEEDQALGSRAGKTQIRYLLESLSSFDDFYIKFGSQISSLPTSKGEARVEVISSLVYVPAWLTGSCHIRTLWASHCNLMRQVARGVYRRDN